MHMSVIIIIGNQTESIIGIFPVLPIAIEASFKKYIKIPVEIPKNI